MAFDPYMTNPYFQAQYPAPYRMPDYATQQPQPQRPEFTSIMTGTPYFGSGGFQGAQGYQNSPGGSVVNTEGQFDTFGTANMIGMAMPGGSFTNAFGNLAQSAFGPYATVGWEEVGIGHPQWDAKMDMQRKAQRMNENYFRAERARAAIEAGTRASPRNTAPGRRGARDTGGGAEAGGGRAGARDNDRSTDGRDHQGWR
jgi:hypothetical protein